MGDSHAALIAALKHAGCKPTQTRDGWRARCPAHDDKTPSLSVGHGTTQEVVVHCHAGCSFEAIMAALHLDRPPRVINGRRSTRPALGDPIAVYDYGTYEVCRFAPKTFRQRRPDGQGGYTWSLKGIAPRLYHQDTLRGRVVIAEGEKDVDRLRSYQWPATCNSGGAGKWRDTHTAALVSAGVKHVTIIPDTNAPGRAHAQAVAARCHAAGIAVKVARLPDPYKDVSNYLDNGGSVTTLTTLCTAAPRWLPADATLADDADLPVARLEPINAFTPEQTEWVIPGWLASGEFHLLAGQAGMGKSTLAMKVAAMVSRSQDFNGDPCAGGDVVLWSGEDHYTKTLLPRLLVNGADPAHVHFVRMVDHASGDAREFTPADDMPALARALSEQPGVRLVILDPILAIAARARDSYRPEDVRKCLLPIQALTRGRGVAVLGITHFLKRHNSTGSDPLDRVIGSQAWAAVARIVWAVDKLDTGGRGLMLAKSNLGSSAGGYTYELVEELLPTDDPPAAAVAGLTVRFPGTLDGEAADVFRTVPVNPRDKDRETALDSAADWLKAYLTDQGRSWADVKTTGKTEGYTEISLRRARDRLKVAGIIQGEPGVSRGTYMWRLVASATPFPTTDT